MIGLVELAQRYVSLSAELEETRSAMRAALMNGSDRNPTNAGSSGPPNKGMDREAVLAQSKAADERVLALLREKPMRPSEIARATQGKLSTNARAPAKTAQARRSRARGGRLAPRQTLRGRRRFDGEGRGRTSGARRRHMPAMAHFHRGIEFARRVAAHSARVVQGKEGNNVGRSIGMSN